MQMENLPVAIFLFFYLSFFNSWYHGKSAIGHCLDKNAHMNMPHKLMKMQMRKMPTFEKWKLCKWPSFWPPSMASSSAAE